MDGRNQKKGKGRRYQSRQGMPSNRGLTLEEGFEYGFNTPGSWLEAGYLDQPSFEERMGAIGQGGFLSRNVDDYEDAEEDEEEIYDLSSDIGSDFDVDVGAEDFI